jgi:pantoate--beta-alanine ligase
MTTHANELRRQGLTLGLVPTMGFLHEGHLSLIRNARKQSDRVVVSIFVNPTQFGPHEDFKEYPRDFERDCRLAEEAGADVIFAPAATDMYPDGFQTLVRVEHLTAPLCGVSRPHHFQGVTTVVAKLFNICKPHLAVFGQKDAQQAIVIRRMVKDLNMDLRIVIAPIVREPDGLAMSSRNTYLTREQREQAVKLYHSLQKAEERIRRGETEVETLKMAMRALIESIPGARIDYVEIVDAQTLVPVARIHPGDEILVALAVYVGKTRLIDNLWIGGAAME